MKNYVVREKISNTILIVMAENMEELQKKLVNWAMERKLPCGFMFEGDTFEDLYLDKEYLSCEDEETETENDEEDILEQLKNLHNMLCEMGGI